MCWSVIVRIYYDCILSRCCICMFQVFSDALALMTYMYNACMEMRGCSFCFHMVASIYKYSPIEQPGISPVEQPGKLYTVRVPLDDRMAH